MAAPILRRTLISFFSDINYSLPHKSHFSFSLHFSTESAKPPLDLHTVTKFLIDRHHFSPDAAAHIAAATRLRTQKNADSILSFLKQTGFSTPQLEKIFKTVPHLLSAHLDANIKPKFEIFHNLGFAPDEVVEIITRQSRVLNHSAPRILSAAAVLKTALGSTAAAAKFMKASGAFLCDMKSTFLPNVEYLKSCGVAMEQIVRLNTSPQLFLHKPENFRKFVERADAMGSDRNSRSYIYAVRAMSSLSNECWELKLKTLRELGFSEGDLVRAFKSSPKVFNSSTEKMKRVADALLGTGKYDRAAIASNPVVFQYSLERRIRPRLEVLRALEEKSLIRNWPSLATMALLTDACFFEKFVAPYLDQVGDLWSGGKVKD